MSNPLAFARHGKLSQEKLEELQKQAIAEAIRKGLGRSPSDIFADEDLKRLIEQIIQDSLRPMREKFRG